MRLLYAFVLFITIVLGLTFASLNADLVTVRYYVNESQLPLSFLLTIAFGIGSLIGLFVGLKMYLRVKRENFRLMHRVKIAEKEVANLRVVSLKGMHAL